MDPREKKDILNVLTKTIEAINKDDTTSLKDLSNQVIHDASIYQEHHTISVAVLVYGLSKVYERTDYKSQKSWKPFSNNCLSDLIILRDKLNISDEQGFDFTLREFIKKLDRLDNKLRLRIKEVMNKAKIHKASRLHEHGISIGRTAELLGITSFELMDYVGKTGIADVKEAITLSAKDRLEIARGLFK